MARKDPVVKPGDVFECWTVLEFSHQQGHNKYWWCRCGCGREKPVGQSHLRSGKSTRCNRCKNKGKTCEGQFRGRLVHGMTGTRLYQIWQGMRRRCSNQKNQAYKYYGGRGIQVCSRWDDFLAFASDMGLPPSDKHSIDRIDVNGNYEPGNCRWATDAEQARNKRNNCLLTHDGKTMCVQDWADLLGWDESTIRHRLCLGWAVEDALTRRPESGGPLWVTIDDVTNTLSEWAKQSGVKADTIKKRLANGWDARSAVFTPARAYNPRK